MEVFRRTEPYSMHFPSKLPCLSEKRKINSVINMHLMTNVNSSHEQRAKGKGGGEELFKMSTQFLSVLPVFFIKQFI